MCLGNVKSDPLQIQCGVLQDSVLGPLLFLLYFNDFQNSSDLLDFHIFADDSSLFQLKNIHKWLCTNKLSLNIKKSSFVIFHLHQKVLPFTVKLVLKDQNLKQTDNMKYLGVVIDSHLNWKSHVYYTTKKIKRKIGIISQFRLYVDQKTLINLHYTLICPFLTYGIIVWENTYFSIQIHYFFSKKGLYTTHNFFRL